MSFYLKGIHVPHRKNTADKPAQHKKSRGGAVGIKGKEAYSNKKYGHYGLEYQRLYRAGAELFPYIKHQTYKSRKTQKQTDRHK